MGLLLTSPRRRRRDCGVVRKPADVSAAADRDRAPAGPRGTWCRRWRSPTRCGLRAPRSSSSAASAPSASSSPPRATSWPVTVAGMPHEPAQGGTRGRRRAARSAGPARDPAAPAGRRARRRRLCRRAGRAGGGRLPHPARADRGRQPPRALQPPARAAAPAGCAWPSRSTGPTAALPASPGGPSPRRPPTRQAARARFGIGPNEPCVLVFGGSQGARSINRAAVEAFAGAPLPRSARRRRARPARPRVRPERTTTCAATCPRSARRSWPATWWSPAPAARSSRSPPTEARRADSLSVRHRRSPDGQRAVHGASAALRW